MDFFYLSPKIARNLKCYMKILTKYLTADLSYYFLNKEDLETDDFSDKPSNKKFETDKKATNLSILSVLEEEIMHFSVDKLHIRCLNLNLTEEKQKIKEKFIIFEINKLKMNINTEKLGKIYDKNPDFIASSKERISRIFHINDISLIFSEITKCVFKNISIDIKKKDDKYKDNFFDFTIEKIEINSMKDKTQNFFLCPFFEKKLKKNDFLKKTPAFYMELKVFDGNIKNTTIKLLPVSLSISTQKTNAILQSLNVLMEMNKHEYRKYKRYLKKEVLQEGYKEIIRNAGIEIEGEQRGLGGFEVDSGFRFIKNEKEIPRITIEFKKIFLILSKNEEVF